MFIDSISDNHASGIAVDIDLLIKDDKHKEPFNFYITDDGKIRIFANGFIDATNKAFSDYIDNKIKEYNEYGSKNNDNEYLNLYKRNNNIDTLKINTESAIYLDDPSNASNINSQMSI
jgi:hypothetical protein